MQSRVTIHQWRDWILEHIGGNAYGLTSKGNKSVTCFFVNPDNAHRTLQAFYMTRREYV